MKTTPEIVDKIHGELLRLSLKLHDGIDREEGQTVGFIINQLVGILVGFITIDDYHDKLADAPDAIKEYYLNLLH
jgi:hypothetical protein